ncbi:MAG TPA: metallophosphoesterase family protein [Ilumatobacteraceae bacterium]|nr:metallophosphoesterase family protein [Ilumatobacteraceae bacterium]
MSDVGRALVVADTHLREGQGARLIDRLRAADLTDGFDAVLHAGDLVHADVLDTLAEIAPVHAVLGNNDLGVVLPERTEVRIGGRLVAMVHDSGTSAGRTTRLRRWFPSADVVVFGHSHIPWHETHVDDGGHVQHHLNPGSAMQRRRQPGCTVAVLELGPDVVDVDIVGV